MVVLQSFIVRPCPSSFSSYLLDEVQTEPVADSQCVDALRPVCVARWSTKISKHSLRVCSSTAYRDVTLCDVARPRNACLPGCPLTQKTFGILRPARTSEFTAPKRPGTSCMSPHKWCRLRSLLPSASTYAKRHTEHGCESGPFPELSEHRASSTNPRTYAARGEVTVPEVPIRGAEPRAWFLPWKKDPPLPAINAHFPPGMCSANRPARCPPRQQQQPPPPQPV